MAWCCAPPRPKSRGASCLTIGTGCSFVFGISEVFGGSEVCGMTTGDECTSAALVGWGCGAKAVGLADGEVTGGSLAGDVALDFASIASTSALAVPYLFLETVMTSCRRVVASSLFGS